MNHVMAWTCSLRLWSGFRPTTVTRSSDLTEEEVVKTRTEQIICISLT